MAGRLFLLLTVGMVIASVGSLFMAERARQQDSEQIRRERVALSVLDVSERMRQQPEEFGRLLRVGLVFGALPAPNQVSLTDPDIKLTAMLRQRMGEAAHPEIGRVPVGLCLPPAAKGMSRRAAGFSQFPGPDCWVVRFVDHAGATQSLSIYLPPLLTARSSTLDPAYLLIVVAASGLLAMIVGKLAATPLRRLTEAARAVTINSDFEPIPERGPTEVRAALKSFNVMQQRVRDGLRDRTQLLAAISHDLQTPLTRLRLRIEQVEDETLRKRLTADIAATQLLVREGLELARSSESQEPMSNVDIDSLLSSIAEDASEFGALVTFETGQGVVARVKPNALARAIVNLVDNAVKYGGSAHIECVELPNVLEVTVRDHGPGIPEDRIEAMFAAFERGDVSRSRATGGTGLGLTIARAQAGTFGAVVSLANQPGGGILATIAIPR
jgi:signal transduction histidine kinase